MSSSFSHKEAPKISKTQGHIPPKPAISKSKPSKAIRKGQSKQRIFKDSPFSADKDKIFEEDVYHTIKCMDDELHKNVVMGSPFWDALAHPLNTTLRKPKE